MADIVAQFGGDIRGDAATAIDSVGSLSGATERQLAFYETAAHAAALKQCQAGALLVSTAHADVYAGPRWVVKKSPRLHFARLAQWLQKQQTPPATGAAPEAAVATDVKLGKNISIAPGAVVESGVSIGDNCRIGPGAVVGAGVQLGAGSVLMAGAVLYAKVKIGGYCIIHSGAVIGADGFGFVRDDSGAQVKIPQLGGVQLGERVEVGANSAIDRGALDDTRIGDGVKIDNLVQIGHNVHVGDNTVICGCAAIAGSTVIGANCMIGGGAGIAGHLHIGDGAVIAARAAVTRSVAAGQTVSSVLPAMPVRQWRRLVGGLRRAVLHKERNKP